MELSGVEIILLSYTFISHVLRLLSPFHTNYSLSGDENLFDDTVSKM